MGKKKGKRGEQSGDVVMNDIDDLDKTVAEIEGESQVKKAPKKSKKKQQDNWEDEVLNEIEEMKLEDGGKGKDSKLAQPETEKKEDDKKDDVKPIANSNTNNDNNDDDFYIPSDEESNKKKKKGKNQPKQDVDPEVADLPPEESTVKTKAQKLSEKKERERKKKEQQRLQKQKKEGKANDASKEDEAASLSSKAQQSSEKQTDTTIPEDAAATVIDPVQDEGQSSTSKKKDKKKKKAKESTEDEKKTKRKPNKAMIKAMQEQLSKIKEEEERLKREEEEKLKKAEEAEAKRLQKVEEERLRKEKRKLREKEKIQRLKREGKYLTPAQKEAQRKREAYVESLRQQGLLPTERDTSEKPKKPRYEDRRRKKQQKPEEQMQQQQEDISEEREVADEVNTEKEMEETEQKEVEQTVEEDEVEDDWENISVKDSDEDEMEMETAKKDFEPKGSSGENEEEDKDASEDESSGEESEEEEEEDSEEEECSARGKAERRIQKRKENNERNKDMEDKRSPVICVMGHVDTGKTKILDKIRHSHVQDGEAGGITQQIGATYIPVEAIKEQTKMVDNFNIELPGLLVIDTPGHESFSNLRSRGSSVCDMAILVVDIMHGLEPQTLESIAMLKKRKTPFLVALNKIDRLYEWKRGPDSDIVNTLKKQKRHVKDEFETKVNDIVVQFATQNLNVKLFHENDDPTDWISLVPTSAHSGDGMGNLMALIVQFCQTMLAKRLAYSEELQCTVLEVKAIQGLGTTIDVILTNGRLKYGDTIVIAGVDGPIVTHVKGLLMPQPLKELRVKNPYNKFDALKAAQGVKILAKDLDKALAGTQLLVAHYEDEIEILKEEVQEEVEKTLKSIKLQERGVYVQASTLGSLEALLAFLKQSKIPFAGISIGPVHKKDIMKSSVMLEHDSQWAVILAFDVKVEREAQELADSMGVKIFTADIIYHLFDSFMQHREDLKRQKQEEFRSIAVFPCKLRILPNCVFKSRDPIIVGVVVEAGQLRTNTPICVPSKEFTMLGYVTSIEFNHKALEMARTGQEICIKIEGQPGEAPKMVGRHFSESDILVSKISRESIDALKDWFRDEMQKSDWQLTIELKKLFEIM